MMAAFTLMMPSLRVSAQSVDSTGMPSLERLATEAGHASRRHPIRAVVRTLLCEPNHPLVDSTALAACAALDSTRAANIITAFARALDVPLVDSVASDLPECPTDWDRANATPTLLARVTAPAAGVRDSIWEGRLTVEMRCRSLRGVETRGKEFLYQWRRGAWELYQHSWWRAER